MDKPKIHPFIPMLIAIIAISFSAILVKLSSADSGVIAFYRMLFSIMIMAPLFFVKHIKEITDLTKRDWLLSCFAGICLAFHFILWFESLNYTSVASSTVLVTLQPLFTFVGTYFFFKEGITVKTVVSATIAVIGSVIISWGDFAISGKALYGDFLALAACALVSAYMLFGQDLRKRVSLMTYTMVVYSVSTICLFLYALLNGESFGPYPVDDWVWFLLLAIVPNLLGHSLFNWAVKWVSANVISIAVLFEPVGASILAYFIFNETLTMLQFIGGLIVIFGIILFVIDFKKYFIKKA